MADLEYLIVGGGASGGFGGGTRSGGGGGAGRLKQGTVTAVVDIFAVTVGEGGAGVTTGIGVSGESSSALGVTANGGGAGAANGDGVAGGHGGGGSGNSVGNPITGGASNDGGFAGGNGNAASSAGSRSGGGGGGEGGVGSNGVATTGGSGGEGVQINFDGSLRGFAGGGAGGGAPNDGVGGSFGGGSAGTDGATPGSGGGGTARNSAMTVTGAGFRGEVMIRYLTGELIATGGTVTTSGLYTIHTFTVDGTFEVTAIGAGGTNELRAGTSAGVATVSGVRVVSIRQAGSANGLSAVSGVGILTIRRAGSASGAATVLGQPTSPSAIRAGTATGAATVTGVGLASIRRSGSAAGAATVSGVSRVGILRAGTSLGSATVTGVPVSSVTLRAGSATGVATVIGVRTPQTTVAGAAYGMATVLGVPIQSAANYPLAAAGDYQPNTFLAALPESIREVSPDLYLTLRDMVEKVRAFNSDALAGGLRLSQIALIRRYHEESIPLGSISAIRLSDGGTAYGRFVQFDSLPESANLGRVVYEGRPEQVSDIGESQQFVGLDFTREGDGLFGWVVVNGVVPVATSLWEGDSHQLIGVTNTGVFSANVANKQAISLPGGKIRVLGTMAAASAGTGDVDLVALLDRMLVVETQLLEIDATYQDFLTRFQNYQDFNAIAHSRAESRTLDGQLTGIINRMMNLEADNVATKEQVILEREYYDSVTGEVRASLNAIAEHSIRAKSFSLDSAWWAEVSQDTYLLAHVESGIAQSYASATITTLAQVTDIAAQVSTDAALVAGSVTAAGNSATAAATSASTAATHATNAGTSATSATNSANTATSQAAAATGAATTATNQATAAATSASSAATQASAAGASATSATTSANTATTQAGVATTQATSATSSAATATTKAAEASASAIVAASFGVGNNLLSNTDFIGDESGWGINSGAGITPLAIPALYGPGHATTAPLVPLGLYALQIGNSATPGPSPANLTQWSQLDSIPVLPGEYYELSVYAAMQRCRVAVVVDFYNEAGAFLASPSSGAGTYEAAPGGLALDHYARIFVKVLVPASAVTARVRLRKFMTETGADSYAWFLRPQFLKVTQTSTSPTPYSPGNANASVSSQRVAIATATTRTASYLERVSAGTGTASLELRATDSGGAAASDITLIANKVAIKNPVGGALVEVAKFEDGIAKISNAMLRNAKVSNNDLSQIFHEIELRPITVLAKDGDVVEYQGGNSYFGTPRIEFDASGLPALAANELYEIAPTAVSGSQFTAKVKKISGGTLTNQDSGVGTNVGGTPVYQVDKPTAADAYNGVYQYSILGQSLIVSSEVVDEGGGVVNYFASYEADVDVYVAETSGAWVKIGTMNVRYNKSGTRTTLALAAAAVTAGKAFSRSQAFTLNALGQHAGKEFGVHATRGTLTGFSGVSYSTQTSGSTTAVTTLIPWKIYPPTS